MCCFDLQPSEFQAAIMRRSGSTLTVNPGLVLEIPTAGDDAPASRSRPTSLTISRVPSLDSLGRPGSQKRPISRVFRDGEDSDSDETGKESPAIMPNQGAFSPKTCRTSRLAASPHFNYSASGVRSPRGLASASPADGILAGLERVRIGGDSQEDVRVTRSRNNSYTTGRSRVNSDSTAGESISTNKSRAGSVDFGRSSSRMGAPILEESKEEMDREEEDDQEIIAANEPFLSNASSTSMQMDGCTTEEEAPSMDTYEHRAPEPLWPQPSAAHSPPLPAQRQGSAQRMGYQTMKAAEDAAGKKAPFFSSSVALIDLINDFLLSCFHASQC